MKRALKYTGIGILALLICGMIGINLITYRATDDISKDTYKNIEISENRDFISLIPQSTKSLPNIIFYNGALVESKAYLGLGARLAEKGFSVYLLKTTFNLSILNIGKALKVSKEIEKPFILMGHSLGGVVAAEDAYRGIEDPNLKGLVFLASYPMDKTNLSDAKFPILSITATEDRVLNQEKWQDGFSRLPNSTNKLIIEGGNHAGFGNYGPQKGDGDIKISREIQQEQVVEKIFEIFSK